MLAAGVTAAAGVLPLVTAGPAHADQFQCMEYLRAHGYVVGLHVEDDCNGAAMAKDASPVARFAAYSACHYQLVRLRVKSRDASKACQLAQV
ncbi:hypothetical protein SNA_27860 [Streptomyces natalensis ATCC 27448]|uniref:Secreted protein n=1 Tax=Streptomyces natalensis ATCC 27448 TaxID=1240678 RepID=A0A0D7CH53_9ACTN|nr:hypothetical protein SNA_27860 [Streptomyces natalensis ATCC 27448]